MRKKKLDQCHQFVLFERSAKQVRPSVCVCLSVNESISLSVWPSVRQFICLCVSLPASLLKEMLNLYFTQKSPVLLFIHSLVPLFINSLVGSIVQALEWIHDTGEFYLSTHTNVGENLTETESLLKEHNEFKVTAKVSIYSKEHNEFKVTAKVSIYSRNTSSRSLPRSLSTQKSTMSSRSLPRSVSTQKSTMSSRSLPRSVSTQGTRVRGHCQGQYQLKRAQ